MSKPHRPICILLLASLVVFVTTACKPPSANESGDAAAPEALPETASETAPETASDANELPNSASSSTPQLEEDPSDGGGENQDTDGPASEASSPEETGVADLEKIVDAIAAKNDPEESGPAASDPASVDTTTQEAAIALDADGLQVITIQTGSIRPIPFESEGDRTIQIVSKILGKPTETAAASECPAGPITVTTWPNGLAINTTDQQFIGWNVRPTAASQALTTVSGVGIGTTVSDLKAVYSVEIFESSLGTEFNVGSLSGLLSAEQPDSTVTNLWAGVNCIFR